MLTKLIKHEWKSVWKIPTVLISILLFLALLSGLTFATPMWQSELAGLNLLMVLVIMIFYFALIGVCIGITLYMAVHFYKSMFSDEGYLTHTLPVSTHQLLISKGLVMIIWNILSILAVLASIAVFGLLAAAFLLPAFPDPQIVMEAFTRIMQEFAQLFGIGFGGFAASILLLLLAGAFSGSMIIMASITLGQMVGKHRVMGSIGAYFALSTVVQIFSTFIIMPAMFKLTTMNSAGINENDVFVLLKWVYLLMSVVSIAITVGLYFLSEFLLRKKLKLE